MPYVITYSAVDASGNHAIEVTRTITVVDTTAPIITLNGGDLTVEAGSVYTDAGASALDAVFGSVPVSVSGSVDTSKVGQYVITYSAVDASGNHAIEVTRTITVVDTTAPIITLNGGDLTS